MKDNKKTGSWLIRWIVAMIVAAAGTLAQVWLPSAFDRLRPDFGLARDLAATAALGLDALISYWGIRALHRQLDPQLPRGARVALMIAIVGWGGTALVVIGTSAFFYVATRNGQ